MNSKSCRQLLVGCLAGLFMGTSLAQDVYPSKSVHVVVPFPPGGPLDLLARLSAQKLTESWGKPVVVENRAGATGTIGTDFVVRAAPDGYTVLLTASHPIVIAPALFKTPYDPTRDLQPVATIGEDTNVLVLHPSLGIDSIPALVAAAKAKPGTLSFGTTGMGSIGHLCMEMIKQATGIELIHVPFQGAAPMVNATVAGQVSMSCGPVPLNASLIRSGKLKGLGVTHPEGSKLLPEVPSMPQAGLKDVAIGVWYGVYVPLKTPAQAIGALRGGFQKAVHDPVVRQKLDAVGIELLWQEADQVSATIKADLAKWTRVIQAGNIKAE
jgi:tripartite-type tricarboxylate transporter receptor subunit TctC